MFLARNVCFVLFFVGAKKIRFLSSGQLSVLHANRRMGRKANWLDSLLKGIVNSPIKSNI